MGQKKGTNIMGNGKAFKKARNLQTKKKARAMKLEALLNNVKDLKDDEVYNFTTEAGEKFSTTGKLMKQHYKLA